MGTSEGDAAQGMNFLAALMLLWLPRERDAFAGLVLLMRDRNLRELYKDGMAMLQACPNRMSDHSSPATGIKTLHHSSLHMVGPV